MTREKTRAQVERALSEGTPEEEVRTLLEGLIADPDGAATIQTVLAERGYMNVAESDAMFRRLEARMFPTESPLARLRAAWADLAELLSGALSGAPLLAPVPAAGYLGGVGSDAPSASGARLEVFAAAAGRPGALLGCASPAEPVLEPPPVRPGDELLFRYEPAVEGRVFAFVGEAADPPRLVYPLRAADATLGGPGKAVSLSWMVDPVPETLVTFVCAAWPYADSPLDLLSPAESGGWEADGEAAIVERLGEEARVCERLAVRLRGS